MESLRKTEQVAVDRPRTPDAAPADVRGARRHRSVSLRIARVAVAGGLVGVSALTALRWVDTASPGVPIVQATVPIGLPASLLLLIVALASRLRLPAFAATALLAVHIGLAAPWWIASDNASVRGTAEEELVVMTSNQQFGTADVEAVVDDVRRLDVDVLVLVEASTVTAELARATGIDQLLPHRVGRPAGDAEGTLIYSRYPLTTDGVPPVPDIRYELPAAFVRAPDGDVLVMAVHPVSPISDDTPIWHRELGALSAWASRVPQEQPLVLAGDFNATIDHPVFRRFGDAGLVDAQRELGRGRRRTWPELRDGPPPMVDIDHVLIRGLDVTSFSRIHMPESDHYAVAAALLVHRR